jgi:hypothetical protein
MLKNAIGAEYYKRFSNEYGDFLTCDVQARVSYDTSEPFDDAWSLELHNAWAEYKLGLGRHLRAGHFSPAFGLEPTVDTHGKLFQTLAGRDIGFKKDWGIGYRGLLGPLDVEAAAQLGSGMGIEHRDDSHLITARAGSPQGTDIQYGVSVLWGNVLAGDKARLVPAPNYADEATFKGRAGVDVQWVLGPARVKAEATGGQNETNAVAGALVEVDVTLPDRQELTVKAQGRVWSGDLDTDDALAASLGLGASYALTQDLTIRMALFHDLAAPGDAEDTRVYVQLYYFGR